MTSKHIKKSLSPGRTLFPAGIGTTLSLIGDTALYTVLPIHTLEAGISLGSVGVILSVNRVVRLILNSVAGAAYDRSQRRPLFVAALLIGALSTGLYAIKSGFWLLFCGRILWGLAWSGIWIGGSTIILDVTNNENRGRWMGFYQIWFYLGGVLGAFISGLGADWLGYTSMLWLAAGIGAAGWLVSLIFLAETRPKLITDKNTKNKEEISNYLSNSTIWVAALIQGINRFAIAGVLATTLALLVNQQMTMTDLIIGISSLTGIISGLRMIVSMAASPLIGIISDRTSNRWRSTLIMLLLSALSMYLLGVEHTIPILIGLFVSSITGGGLQTLTTSMVGDVVLPTQRGKAISLLYTSGDLGSALGPMAAYAMMPWIGLSGVFFSCAIMFLAVIPITIWESNKTKKIGIKITDL